MSIRVQVLAVVHNRLPQHLQKEQPFCLISTCTSKTCLGVICRDLYSTLKEQHHESISLSCGVSCLGKCELHWNETTPRHLDSERILKSSVKSPSLFSRKSIGIRKHCDTWMPSAWGSIYKIEVVSKYVIDFAIFQEFKGFSSKGLSTLCSPQFQMPRPQPLYTKQTFTESKRLHKRQHSETPTRSIHRRCIRCPLREIRLLIDITRFHIWKETRNQLK